MSEKKVRIKSAYEEETRIHKNMCKEHNYRAQLADTTGRLREGRCRTSVFFIRWSTTTWFEQFTPNTHPAQIRGHNLR
ncbi:Hypothetical predicted protein [Xyrichtys novacula]|uniref:Uncharacterized protein n=1 Tax=Xyrichtys novacula TaxID=13765 RepID=A0AAV1GZY6_XYRNO|nr:Hypothetical predicted protein [Xyrichtys novacula]